MGKYQLTLFDLAVKQWPNPENFEIDDSGRIRSPGKFEREMLYIPYYYRLYLEGAYDFERGNVIGFNITKEDRAKFPKAFGKRRTVKFYERDDGFICEV